MALFVLIIVGVVVAQTWLDWRDAKKDWEVPKWAKGMALAGVMAISLTAATSFASVWLQDAAAQWPGEFGWRLIWPEAGFLACIMGIIVVAVRKKRLHLMLLLTGVLVAAFLLGMKLTS